jgi:hypothetical protein
MSNNVINFRSASARRESRSVPPSDHAAEVDMTPRAIRRQMRQQQEPATETAKNARLREQRKCGWYAAEAATAYWRARMKLHGAISSAVRWRAFPDGMLGELHPEFDDREGWNLLLKNYRAALVKQFLTPAHRSSDVEWKRKALAAGEHAYTGLTTERIEFAIAQDVEFLAAHPTRRSRRPS